MRDLMELRGFEVLVEKEYAYLVTPDKKYYAVPQYAGVANIVCGFHTFLSINHLYP